MSYNIEDWAGNTCFQGQQFASFDDGEDYLIRELSESYDEDRQEYFIVEAES